MVVDDCDGLFLNLADDGAHTASSINCESERRSVTIQKPSERAVDRICGVAQLLVNILKELKGCLFRNGNGIGVPSRVGGNIRGIGIFGDTFNADGSSVAGTSVTALVGWLVVSVIIALSSKAVIAAR